MVNSLRIFVLKSCGTTVHTVSKIARFLLSAPAAEGSGLCPHVTIPYFCYFIRNCQGIVTMFT